MICRGLALTTYCSYIGHGVITLVAAEFPKSPWATLCHAFWHFSAALSRWSQISPEGRMPSTSILLPSPKRHWRVTGLQNYVNKWKPEGEKVNPKKLSPWHFLRTTSLVFCLYTLELESTLGPCSCKTLWFHQQGDKRLYNLFASFRHVNTSIKQAHNSQATHSWAALAPCTVKT